MLSISVKLYGDLVSRVEQLSLKVDPALVPGLGEAEVDPFLALFPPHLQISHTDTIEERLMLALKIILQCVTMMAFSEGNLKALSLNSVPLPVNVKFYSPSATEEADVET